MGYVREKLARTVVALATEPEPIEARVEKVLGRHLYDLGLHMTGEDAEIEKPLDALVERWMKVRQPPELSTYQSEVDAMSIAMEVCNLSSQYPER